MPWLLDPRVPWAAAAVFAKGLASVALEAACVLSPPLAFSLAASAFNDRGEALACQLTGASPARLSLLALPLALPVALAGALASASWGADEASPGRVMVELIEASRRSCDGERRTVADVPGTGAAWLCPPGDRPRLAVLVRDQAVLQLERLSLDGELRELRSGPALLSLRGPPALHLEVGEARVRAASPFARASRLRPWARAAAGALASLAGALACSLSLVRSLDRRRLPALGLGAASGLGPLWLIGAQSRAAAPPEPAALALAATLALPVALSLAPSLAYLAYLTLGAARARRRVSPTSS